MPRKPKIVFENKCNNCGKEQLRNERLSNENWQVYDCGVKCECGGEYVPWLNGIPIQSPKKDGE